MTDPDAAGGRAVPFLLIPLSLGVVWTGLAAETGFPGFVDVAAKVGITLMNVHGGAAKDYILEANGNGAAFFDYDKDGDVDALIVNGSTLENYKKGGDPMVALYRNDNGRFVDVTGSGTAQNKWLGNGCLCRGLRQRRLLRCLHHRVWAQRSVSQQRGRYVLRCYREGPSG